LIERMSEMGSHIMKHLQEEINRGREAEELLSSGKRALPHELLEEWVNRGKQADEHLRALRANRKFYSEECPTGPWSMALRSMRKRA